METFYDDPVSSIRLMLDDSSSGALLNKALRTKIILSFNLLGIIVVNT